MKKESTARVGVKEPPIFGELQRLLNARQSAENAVSELENLRPDLQRKLDALVANTDISEAEEISASVVGLRTKCEIVPHKLARLEQEIVALDKDLLVAAEQARLILLEKCERALDMMKAKVLESLKPFYSRDQDLELVWGEVRSALTNSNLACMPALRDHWLLVERVIRWRFRDGRSCARDCLYVLAGLNDWVRIYLPGWDLLWAAGD